MSEDPRDRTASLMTPAQLAQLKMRPQVASPAAFLDQLAADAGSGHVRRLLDLRRQLEAQVRELRYAPVTAACTALAGALGKLDFSLLEPKGWLARATGKGKEAAAAFAAEKDRCLRAADDLADEVRALEKRQQAQGALTERTVVEFDVETRAIEKIMDQGARWLQDMRNQLKAREAEAEDRAAHRKVVDDEVRCEMLVERLKLLRTANSASLHAVEQCRSAAARRESVVGSLQQLLEGEWKACRAQLESLAEEAGGGGATSEALAGGRKSQQRLQQALQQAVTECSGLQSLQASLADELAALQAPLQAAA